MGGNDDSDGIDLMDFDFEKPKTKPAKNTLKYFERMVISNLKL